MIHWVCPNGYGNDWLLCASPFQHHLKVESEILDFLCLDFFGTSFPLWIKSRNRDLLGAPAYTLRIIVLDYQVLGPLFQQHMHDLEETKENSWTKTNRHLRWLGSYLRLQNKFRVVKVKDLTMWAVFLQRDLIKELPFTWNNHNHTSGELSSKVASE